MKPELYHHILAYVTTLRQHTSYLNSTTTAPVRPYRNKGETNYVSLNVYFWGKKMVFFTPHFFFNYKNAALFVLRAALPCLPACISHKHLTLINSLFAHHFAS